MCSEEESSNYLFFFRQHKLKKKCNKSQHRFLSVIYDCFVLQNRSVGVILSISNGRDVIPIKIITVLNYKGGTGKTTTVRNMAHILATKYGKHVLLGDLDSSGNLSSACSRRLEDKKACPMYFLFADRNADPHDFIQNTSVENIDIISANNTLRGVDTVLIDDHIHPQQFALSRQVKKLKHDYDYLILDCPPSEMLVNINALVCSHEVIIPTNVNQDSMDAVRRVNQMVMEVEEYNPIISIAGVLFTRITSNKVDRDGIADSTKGELLPEYPKYKTYIRECVEVERARFNNMSLNEYRDTSKGKKFSTLMDYENFVAEYLGEDPVYPEAPYYQ